jgi:UDP-N-acetyl-2-amino-2-deoxyglucuronate dehydrogenase
VIDSYFPNCKFFMQQERFDRHVVKNEKLDYISICSPNYLHESHCKLGMRLGSDIICEKPLALTLDNLKQLEDVEKQTGKKVYSILQLRLHPSIKLIKYMLKDKRYKVKLTYITPRGNWYHQSWKGNLLRSGGIETNIGIHFFDMLIWLFGDVVGHKLISKSTTHSKGELTLKNADVEWLLSIDRNDLPNIEDKFFRSMLIDDEEVRFDNVFSELHTDSYKEILNGNGFGIKESMKAISLVETLRGYKWFS